MTSSLALGAARCRVKCRQRHRRARNRASKNAICGADRVLLTGMQHCSGRYWRVRGRPSVVQEPYARRETTRARTERPRRHPGPSHRIGTESQKRNPGVNASEESNIGIVPAKPPNKVGRDTGGGGGGGKAGDQGEHHDAQHVPDTDQGNKRVPRAGWCTQATLNVARRHDAPRRSKVRTVCSSSCKYGSVRGVAGNGHPYRDASVGINRRVVGDERAPQERSSEPS